MSTITNHGELSFMGFEENFTAAVFIQFLRRLMRLRQRKVLLIVDRHPVHLSALSSAGWHVAPLVWKCSSCPATART